MRVMRPDVPAMRKAMSLPNPEPWYKAIRNKRVIWGSETFRPRARYLYWAYMVTLLRNLHDKGKGTKGGRQGVAASVAQGQIGRMYWGSTGAYTKKNMLLGFLEELGYAYDEELMEAVMDQGSENEPSELAVMIAIEVIISKSADAEESDDDDDDSDDDE